MHLSPTGIGCGSRPSKKLKVQPVRMVVMVAYHGSVQVPGAAADLVVGV